MTRSVLRSRAGGPRPCRHCHPAAAIRRAWVSSLTRAADIEHTLGFPAGSPDRCRGLEGRRYAVRNTRIYTYMTANDTDMITKAFFLMQRRRAIRTLSLRDHGPRARQIPGRGIRERGPARDAGTPAFPGRRTADAGLSACESGDHRLSGDRVRARVTGRDSYPASAPPPECAPLVFAGSTPHARVLAADKCPLQAPRACLLCPADLDQRRAEATDRESPCTRRGPVTWRGRYRGRADREDIPPIRPPVRPGRGGS